MAGSNRDEVQERLVKVNTANKHKMKCRPHFRNNNKMEEMHKTLSEQMPSTFLKASHLNPIHHVSFLFYSLLRIWFSLIPLANNIIRQINFTES